MTPAAPRAAVAAAAATIGQALAAAAASLKAAGVAEPRLDARLLLAHCLGVDAGRLLGWPERPLPADAAGDYAGLIAARAARRPLARVIGRREFWGLSFAVTDAVLDPRPDSECLVEAALAAADRARPLTVFDFGTGSGCLLIALLSELPLAEGVGIDCAPAALAVARTNAERLGVGRRARFVASDWGESVGGMCDLALSNPPYIRRGEIESLAPEVARFDPRLALDGGSDGLTAYRRLAPDLAACLRPGGVALVEIGDDPAGPADIFAAVGLALAGIRDDLAGRPRCLVLNRAA
jgi:release factor glutamine methyltransferase